MHDTVVLNVRADGQSRDAAKEIHVLGYSLCCQALERLSDGHVYVSPLAPYF